MFGLLWLVRHTNAAWLLPRKDRSLKLPSQRSQLHDKSPEAASQKRRIHTNALWTEQNKAREAVARHDVIAARWKSLSAWGMAYELAEHYKILSMSRGLDCAIEPLDALCAQNRNRIEWTPHLKFDIGWHCSFKMHWTAFPVATTAWTLNLRSPQITRKHWKCLDL